MKKYRNILLSYRVQRFDAEILEKIIKYKNDKIYIVVQDIFELNFFKALIKLSKELKNINLNINIITAEAFLKGELNHMLNKFDYIVGNPPYQIVVGPNKTQQIWASLTTKFYLMLKEGAGMTLVHPGSWRFSTTKSMKDLKGVRDIYQTNKITKMELNDKIKGQKTFGANTDYDVISIVKEKSTDDIEIETLTDGKFTTNISKMGMIPTDNFGIFNKLKAKDNEEKVELLYSASSYGTRKKCVSDIKDSEFKYPVIDRMLLKEGIKYIYSNTKDNGHFGVPKLILGRAGYYSVIDIKGEYGMTQFVAGIVDTPENLIKIQKVLESDNLKKVQVFFTGSSDKNSIVDARGTMFKFIKEFKKDFWKEFYTSEMEKELIKEGKLNPDGSYKVNIND